MSAWKGKIAGFEVKIHDVDHWPPHCHISMKGRNMRVDLRTLEYLNPPPHSLPAKLRKGLMALQSGLLKIWEEKVIQPGGKGG
jgi:hypothetical protein